jgi:hypothetical protein
MKLTNEQNSFLDKVVSGKWSINSDTNLIDVEGSVDMSNLTNIPVKFGNVTDYFNFSYKELTSLIGASKSIGRVFKCTNNPLTILEGASQSIGDYYIIIDLAEIDKKYQPIIID